MMARLIYALQFLSVAILVAIVGPFYGLLILGAAWFGWSEKRRLARLTSRHNN